MLKNKLILLLALLLLAGSSHAISKEALTKYPRMKVWVTTYYANHWSDTGRYRQVSKNGKRLGDFVALNFLPGGSLVMIPRLFDSTVFEVADTYGGSGRKVVKGICYWKVDVLRNAREWYDTHDFPVVLYIVKYNRNGQVKNRSVRKNCLAVYKKLYKKTTVAHKKKTPAKALVEKE
jgi:hypothetical protein